MDRRKFLIRSASTVAAAAVGAGLYTWRVEPHWLRFEQRELPIRRLPADLDGRRLVQLSDFHAGRVDNDYLSDALERTAALAPDFVVFTGDFVDAGSTTALWDLAAVLPHFPHGRLGTVAVLGNHDHGVNWNQPEIAGRVAQLVVKAGIRLLHNEAATFGGLQFVGLGDLWAGEFAPERALSSADPAAATLVLSHNPDSVDRTGLQAGVDWILCGHTHGGQCKPPFLPPPILPVVNKRYSAGEISLSNGRRLYINRGVGHVLRVRFNVRPEVTVFTLRRG